MAEAARGRAFLAEIASQAGFAPERVFDITVACSEAIANAIEHSPVKGEVQVRAVVRSDRLEVEVEGPGEFQAPDRLGKRETRGLGLPLMARLSDHLALFSGPKGGTFVSLTFYRPGVEIKDGGAIAPSFANLAEENRLLDYVLVNLPECFYAVDKEWRILYTNPAVVRRVSKTTEELAGMLIWDAFPGCEPLVREKFERARETGSSVTFTARGHGLCEEVTAFPVEEGLAVISRDIRARVQAEEALRTSEERMRHIAQVTRIGFFEWKAAGETGYWSPEHQEIFGYEPGSSVFWEQWIEGVHPEDRERVAENASRLLDRARSEGHVQGHRDEYRFIRADGRVVWVESHISVDLVGDAPVVRGSVRDVTDRKRAEEALKKSEERYRVLADENERLYRQQLNIAENLQMALINIPSEIGPLRIGHLYRSATEAARVGGDFYDVFELKDNKVALLVGDVAGHGVQAARTATLVKDVVHAFTHQSIRPHEVLKRTNELLLEKDLAGFVTLFLGILDIETGTLRYASAGHPETLLRRTAGEIEPLGDGSTPIGVYSNITWRPGIVQMEPGDRLLLYTDGVTDSRRNGEFFGRKRLESILGRKRLSVERLPHMVLDQVLAFSGGRLSDDVAVLAVSLNTESRAAGQGQE